MSKIIYEVHWDGELVTYKQRFDNISEARMAMALHNSRNARIIIFLDEDS